MIHLLCATFLGCMSLLDTLSYTEQQRLVQLNRLVRLIVIVVYLLGPMLYCAMYLKSDYFSLQLLLVVVASSTFATLTQIFRLVAFTRWQSSIVSRCAVYRMPFEFGAVLMISPVSLFYSLLAYFVCWAGLKVLMSQK
jgi:hypothetical protein